MSELPRGWTQVYLGEVVQPRKEKANPQKLGDLPFIGLEHVEAHSSRLLGTSRASDVKSAVVIFKAGDVLYGRLRPYLNKVIQPDFAGCAGSLVSCGGINYNENNVLLSIVTWSGKEELDCYELSGDTFRYRKCQN